MIFADGRIVLYQVVINTLRLLSIVVAYFILRTGVEPHALFYVYIVFSLLIVIATQWCLYKTIHYDNSVLIRKSYIPSLSVLALFLLFLLLPNVGRPIIRISTGVVYLLCIEFFIGLSNKEKEYIKSLLVRKIK